jgi:hypothetical protein
LIIACTRSALGDAAAGWWLAGRERETKHRSNEHAERPLSNERMRMSSGGGGEAWLRAALLPTVTVPSAAKQAEDRQQLTNQHGSTGRDEAGDARCVCMLWWVRCVAVSIGVYGGIHRGSQPAHSAEERREIRYARVYVKNPCEPPAEAMSAGVLFMHSPYFRPWCIMHKRLTPPVAVTPPTTRSSEPPLAPPHSTTSPSPDGLVHVLRPLLLRGACTGMPYDTILILAIRPVPMPSDQ